MFSDSRPFLEPSGALRKTQQDGTQQRGHDCGHDCGFLCVDKTQPTIQEIKHAQGTVNIVRTLIKYEAILWTVRVCVCVCFFYSLAIRSRVYHILVPRRHNLLQPAEAETEQIAPRPLPFEIETASFFSTFFSVFVFFSLSGLFAFFR